MRENVTRKERDSRAGRSSTREQLFSLLPALHIPSLPFLYFYEIMLFGSTPTVAVLVILAPFHDTYIPLFVYSF